MASSSPTAIIILGNSGVGKSFLANRLLNDDQAFESRFSARSVTHQTEWKNYRASNTSTEYVVGNIPGLIENNQKAIDENRHEIMKAFEQYPWAIVLFVFGHKNGRIPDEDLVAFARINDAYQFPSQSLLVIVNGIPSDRPNGYEERTKQLLHEITHVDENHIYFIEKVTNDESKILIHRQLHEAIAKCKPVHHTKKHDIELLVDEISRLKKESQQLQNQLLAQEQQQKSGGQSLIDIHRQIPNFNVSREATQTRNTSFLTTHDEEQRRADHAELRKSAEDFTVNNQRLLSQIAELQPLPNETQKKSRFNILKRKADPPETTASYYTTEIVPTSEHAAICQQINISTNDPNAPHIDINSYTEIHHHHYQISPSNDDRTTRF